MKDLKRTMKFLKRVFTIKKYYYGNKEKNFGS